MFRSTFIGPAILTSTSTSTSSLSTSLFMTSQGVNIGVGVDESILSSEQNFLGYFWPFFVFGQKPEMPLLLLLLLRVLVSAEDENSRANKFLILEEEGCRHLRWSDWFQFWSDEKIYHRILGVSDDPTWYVYSHLWQPLVLQLSLAYLLFVALVFEPMPLASIKSQRDLKTYWTQLCFKNVSVIMNLPNIVIDNYSKVMKFHDPSTQ